MKIDLKDIKPNPINDDIYSSTDLTDLVQSIKDNGQLEKIVVNKKNVIVSGHRRYYAHKQLGLKQIDCVVSEFDNDIIALIEFNRSRVKSVQDILNESRFLEKEYKRRIGQGKRTDYKGQGKMSTIVEVSKQVGIGATNLKKVKSINNYEPELLSKIDSKELSIDKAYQIVRDKHMKTKKSSKSKFNQLFRNLLNKEQPELDEIQSVLKTTYPYSLQLQVNIDSKLEGKRIELVDNLEMLKSLDSKQEVVYRKLKEIEQHNFNPFSVQHAKDNIYRFTDLDDKKKTISDIEKLEPTLELVEDNKNRLDTFNILRTMIHTLEWNANPGRLLKFIVKDKVTEKYLGIITCGSDFTTLGVRDDFIGWSDLHKYEMGKLNNTSVVSSIVPVQPFGYNFLGGKLLACISTSSYIRKCWKQRYNDILIGNTTTSLYGDYSMYNSIPLWKKLGHSKGDILIKPDEKIYSFWCDFLKKHYKEEYKLAQSKTSPKQNVLDLIYRIVGIKQSKYKNEFNRGVYFSSFYNNTKEFLTDKIAEKDLELNDKFKSDDWYLDWWKVKAIKRYSKLHSDGKLNHDILWYEDINFDDVKKYLIAKGITI